MGFLAKLLCLIIGSAFTVQSVTATPEARADSFNALGSTGGKVTARQEGTFTNPIKPRRGADPFMIYDQGYYYLLNTAGSNLQIRRAERVGGLKSAEDKVVYTDDNPDRCCNLWAPELHKIDDAWYIYYTATPEGGAGDAHRTHVVRASSSDIWNSTWEYVARITPPNRPDGMSIDATILYHDTGNYIVWSGTGEGDGQNLWIASLTGPDTAGDAVLISQPTHDWEKVNGAINEGPNFIYHDTRIFMSFSASHCMGDGYKLGMTELTGDPLSPASWTKFPEPVFTSANNNWQPGHNAFFLSPSGSQWWNVYHADSVTPGNCDDNRYTSVQPVSWNEDGTPNLGEPLPTGEPIEEPA